MINNINNINNNVIDVIKSCADDVYKDLKYGHSECVYQQALEHELRLRNIQFEQEVVFPILYKQMHYCGFIRCDLIVQKNIVIELKTIDRIIFRDTDNEVVQLKKYMSITGHKTGILINFPKIKKSNYDLNVIFCVIQLN